MECFPGKRHFGDHFGEDFVNAIKKLVTPTRGRKLIVEALRFTLRTLMLLSLGSLQIHGRMTSRPAIAGDLCEEWNPV